MEAEKNLKKTVLSQYIGRIVKILISLILGPLVARYLGPEDLGKLSYVTSISFLLIPLIDLGSKELIAIFLTRKINKIKLINTALTIQLFGTSIVTFILFLFAIFSKNKELLILFILEIFIVIFLYGDIYEYELINLGKGSKVAKVFLAKELTYFFSALAAIFLNAELFVFSLLNVLSSGLRVFLFSNLKVSNIRFTFLKLFKKKLAIIFLSRSLPLILSNVSDTMLMRSDQLMIQAYLGSSELGQYAVSVKVAETLYFLPLILCSSFLPTIGTENLKFDENKQLRKLYKMIWILGVSITLISIFISPIILKILYGEQYLSAIPSLICLGAAGFSISIGCANSIWLKSSNLNKALFVRTTFSLVLNIILNIYFIPNYGILGAAISTTISNYFGIFIVNYLWSKESRINILRAYLPFKLYF